VEKVTLDFEFDKYSYEYGSFLTTCYENDHTIVIADGTPQYWNYYSTNHFLITVDVAPELATLLKIKFRNHLRIRPTAQELRMLKEAREEAKHDAKRLFISDYISLLNDKDYDIIDKNIASIYDELKIWTKDKPK
jgi:hypothetical protein